MAEHDYGITAKRAKVAMDADYESTARFARYAQMHADTATSILGVAFDDVHPKSAFICAHLRQKT